MVHNQKNKGLFWACNHYICRSVRRHNKYEVSEITVSAAITSKYFKVTAQSPLEKLVRTFHFGDVTYYYCGVYSDEQR